MATHILEWEEEFDYEVIAIASTLADYQLCTYLNNHFNLHFKKAKPVEYKNRRQNLSYSFSKYSYFNPLQYLEMHLIGNNSLLTKGERKQKPTDQISLFDEETLHVSTRSKLLPELSQYDYLVLLQTTNYSLSIDKFVDELSVLSNVFTASLINANDIPNKDLIQL